MPSTEPEMTSMDDPHASGKEKGSMANVSPSLPPAAALSVTPLETVIEQKAVSMASNDDSLPLFSPAEASPAKPAVTPPTTINGGAETSQATSHIASASDSLICTGTSMVDMAESPQSSPALPKRSTDFGSSVQKKDFPAVLTFKGVSVTLENNSVWKQFNGYGTEMILTKQGRRMFPYCRYRLSGLDPDQKYSVVLSIVPADQYRYRWNLTKWEINSKADYQSQGLIRAFSHHYSPSRGFDWMSGLLSFYKLKLTNNTHAPDGHIILHSMHRYIPRLHIIPVPDETTGAPHQPVVMGPESMTFTFPQTDFMAVTTYQNFRITQLKINHNPFAKGFREDGHNTRLNRVSLEPVSVVIADSQPEAGNTVEEKDIKEEVLNETQVSSVGVLLLNEQTTTPDLKSVEPTSDTDDVSKQTSPEKSSVLLLPTSASKNRPITPKPILPAPTVPAPSSNQKPIRLVLKPIMSTSSNTDDPYVRCIRGKHALGELVLVQESPNAEDKEESQTVASTPDVQKCSLETPKAKSTPSSPGSFTGHRKRRKKINWANLRGKERKAAAASPVEAHSSSFTVAMQPELDDVEGLLFVSFTSKEALEVHVGDKPANSSQPSPVSLTTPKQMKASVEESQQTDEEKISRLEVVLLHDLSVFRHRQVIHPVLQEVGLKLISLNLSKSIDLQYLGVQLPLPPPVLAEEEVTATGSTPVDEGLPFISRTGKTSDVTKIKGWKNKFMKSKETSSSQSDGSQKNLSAFCSNMLDEYLESEAQYISERAAAFSTDTETSVAYQLPAKSSSYVKTLDSVLKRRKSAPKVPEVTNKPCPLSHKPLLYSALASPAPPLPPPPPPVQVQPRPILPKLPTSHPGSSLSQSQAMTHKPTGFTKFQSKLLQMEMAAQNQGLRPTQLTTERLAVALSVMLTKEMLYSQGLKVPDYPKEQGLGAECGQAFCRLGCVCSSLRHQNRGPLHCRRPECMFGCACFKSKITMKFKAAEIPPVYSMTHMEHVVQPHPDSRCNKLWHRNIEEVDPEPVCATKSANVYILPKIVKRSVFVPTNKPVREEDKGPVYRYLESMMTCARVRALNSQPPPEVKMPNFPNTLPPNTATKPQEKQSKIPLKYNHRTGLPAKKSVENTSQNNISKEIGARKQIEIQSACKWDKDQKMVLEILLQRMNQNRLSQSFYIGLYRICPVAKIFMQKPSGSTVTYRLRISKRSKSSDNEEEYDDSDEEHQASKSLDEDTFAEEEESEMQIGVTPFLSGVVPAGRMRARTKPVNCKAQGLIQVNGKSYNQARLLLGNIGSLHPANRLAAYVTGRLHAPAIVSHMKSEPTNKINPPGPLHIKAAGTVVPPVITARKTTDLKTATQPPVQLSQPDSWNKGPIALSQLLQNSSTINPLQAFGLVRRSSLPFQSSSASSPVSLTVSPSLKTPSFLGQSGTYSFRICPPANQGTGAKNPPGVTLPGGFTLIQLPKPAADGAAQQVKSENTTNLPAVDKAQSLKDVLAKFGRIAAISEGDWQGLNALTGVTGLLKSNSEKLESSIHQMREKKKIPLDEIDATNIKQEESNMDILSDDLDSDSSDYSGDAEEDEDLVDIETVEEARQGMAIAKMKEAVQMALKESRGSSDVESATELQEKNDDLGGSLDSRRRKNHTVLERQRRFEHRTLFDKLQILLHTDQKAPRLHLLSLAHKEIQSLVESSKRLEEEKRRLIQKQSLYLKELSVLCGKPQRLIQDKVKEICDRQKMRERTMKWKPFFSHLLQSRAALLQATTPKSTPPPKPLLQPDFTVPACASAKRHNFLKTGQTVAPSPLKTVSSPAQVGVAAPSQQVEKKQSGLVTSLQVSQHQAQQEKPGAPGLASVPNSKMDCRPQAPSAGATLQVNTPKEGASPISLPPNSNQPAACPPKPFSLPLIRSKTGRIILPSSMKPLGHGFYTLMIMEPRQKGVNDKTQPSSLDSESERPSDPEGRLALEQSAMEPPSDSGGAAVPVAGPACLNKTTFVIRQAVIKNQQEDTAVGLNKSCLGFKEAHQSHSNVKPQPDPSVPVVPKRRGRPPKKHLLTPVSGTEEVVESICKSEENQAQDTSLKATNTQPVVTVSADPVPVKRRRGRPPNRKKQPLLNLWSPPYKRPTSNEDTPARVPSFKSPDTRAKASVGRTPSREKMGSRPLTRGALGKDFPSAKKRSWIDMEKELEPEIEDDDEEDDE